MIITAPAAGWLRGLTEDVLSPTKAGGAAVETARQKQKNGRSVGSFYMERHCSNNVAA